MKEFLTKNETEEIYSRIRSKRFKDYELRRGGRYGSLAFLGFSLVYMIFWYMHDCPEVSSNLVAAMMWAVFALYYDSNYRRIRENYAFQKLLREQNWEEIKKKKNKITNGVS